MGKGYSLEYKIGEYKGVKVLLYWEAQSSTDEPVEFSTGLTYFDRKTEKRVKLARIDNSHGRVHIHRFWRGQKKGEDLKWRGDNLELFWRAIEYLQDNWKNFVRSVL